MREHSGFFHGQDGLKLHYQSWIPETPRSVLCLVHGLGEYGARYEPLAQFLYEREIATYAIDLRGHGKSSGKRGHASGMEILTGDVEELLKTARAKFNDLPMHLMGHSMGGNIVANFLLKDTSKEIESFILSSPWLGLAHPVSGFKEKLAKIMSRIFPSYAQNNGLNADDLSNDPEEIKAYKNNPWIHSKISARLYTSIKKGAEKVMQDAASFKHKGLIYWGSEDQIISADLTAKFAKSNKKFEWKTIEGAKHEPHNDQYSINIFEDIYDWIVKRKK